ncbi:MAG: hypothetical protein HYX78_09950 [Armatimonadetes bacterium]|nr:hypothetical protein [Armatimonadota bacterium]
MISPLTLALVVVLVASAPNVSQSCMGMTEDGGDVIKDAGIRVLKGAGINQPSDIESAVVAFGIQGTYKITWKDDPDLISGVYEGLRVMEGYPEAKRPLLTSLLVLYLNANHGLRIRFMEWPPHAPRGVAIWQIYGSGDLLSVFQKIKRNARAATRDGRVPAVEPASLEVQVHKGERVAISLTSEEGRVLQDKAVALLDWIDPRIMNYKTIKPEEFEELGHKYGIVYLKLAKPVSMVVDTTTDRGSLWPEFRTDVSYGTVTFDAFAVLDTGNVRIPQLALHDKQSSSYYLTQGYLYRRTLEHYGVEILGFPGHPLTDTEYYKKPEILYAEMEELVKKAVGSPAK